MMIALCPCCNRPMEAGRAPIDGLAGAALTNQQRQMVAEMVRVYPKSVSRDRLFDILYQLDPDGGPESISNNVAVRIHKIRKVIERFGWTIPKQHGGTGIKGFYRLAPLDLAA
ncbi:helix-turn-helix domain-containing protein [Mesorhizobium sp. M0514]|uniref:helix-turn-helix domain-containing protein n=1 Tax=Mesorhizobium sp. M0514 TaxID=2956955 RepID=UPI0033355AF5